MSQTLTHKRALVTGGSRGIGAGIVKRLAQEGADVALTYANSPERAKEVVQEAQAFGVRSFAIQADSADPEAVTAAVERTVSEFGGIDILVNSAGILVFGPLEEIQLAEFDQTLAVNVRAVFVAAQAAAKHMREGSRIINIGSTSAERSPFSGGGVYSMSKAALQGLVRGLARDLGPRGITINNVQPRPHRHRAEPGRRPFRREDQNAVQRSSPFRNGRGSCGNGRLSRWSRGWLYHRRQFDD